MSIVSTEIEQFRKLLSERYTQPPIQFTPLLLKCIKGNREQITFEQMQEGLSELEAQGAAWQQQQLLERLQRMKRTEQITAYFKMRAANLKSTD